MNCILMVDKNRWFRDEKGNLKKSNRKIPQEKMKAIIEFILNEVRILSEEEISNNVNDVLKTYIQTTDPKLIKEFVKRVNDVMKTNYDNKFIVESIYEKFNEVITTEEISKIIALKKAF